MAKLTRASFYGVSNLPLTALNEDRTINVDSTEKYIDFLVERKATSLWFMGFLGECQVLPQDHKKQLIDIYSSYAKGRTLTGAGCHSQKACETIELANYAEKKGCDFAWITPPWCGCMSYADLKAYYKQVIDNTSIDLALYNSGGTGIYLPPQFIGELYDMAPDRWVAFKDSQGILAHVSELFRLGLADKMAYLPVAGESYYAMDLGTESLICTPEQQMLSVALFEAMKAGDRKKAMHYQHRLMGGYPLLAYWGSALNMGGILTMPFYMYAQKEACTMITGIPLGPYMAETPRPAELVEKMKKYVEWWNPLDIDAPLPEKEWGYTM